MKDITLFSADTEIARLRVDSISGSGNLSVMESYGLDDREPFASDDADLAIKVKTALAFKKIPSTMEAIEAFATDNSLIMKISDSNGAGASFPVGGSIEITTLTLPDGEDGAAYDEDIVVTGGSEDYTFEVTDGELPSGLSLDASTGTIDGTPDTVETQTFTVTVTDNLFGFTAELEYTVEIAA